MSISFSEYGGDRMNRKIYRRWLIVIFAVYLAAFFYYLSYWIQKAIPDVWRMTAGQEETLDFNIPLTVQTDGVSIPAASINGEKVPSNRIHLNLSQPVSVNIKETGSYKVSVSCMGVRLKNVKVDVVDEIKVMPLGMPVGIYIRTKGVMVLGTGDVTTFEGSRITPAKDILESGDYILEAAEKPVISIDSFTQTLKNWEGGELILKIWRNGQEMNVRITPVRTDDAEYKIGAWIRQDAQGIGTLSYVDADNHFGALGHGITDIDTSQRIDIRDGNLYQSTILSVVKGKNGSPGEMIGNIDYKYGQILGEIKYNSENGIFGTLGDNVNIYDESQALPVGLKYEIKKGAASIRCCVDDEIKDYDIEIESIDMGNFAQNKDMVIRICDEELLSKTNGIIQGMSGSPIIQNGKFIGAVTHVFVEDSTRGYGIFAERMLNENVE